MRQKGQRLRVESIESLVRAQGEIGPHRALSMRYAALLAVAAAQDSAVAKISKPASRRTSRSSP